MEQIPSIIHESWHEHLQPLFDDKKMKLIKESILPKAKFYPQAKDIFRVFSMPLTSIKIVILGQDPYPNGEGIGYAFAVNENTPCPPSLNVIFKEVYQPETAEEFVSQIQGNKHLRTLQHWTEQGVFLMNTALTVEAKKAGSHLGYWEWFAREVVKIISKEVTPIWLLWGAKAQAFESIAKQAEMFKVNHFLKAPHPAAELYAAGTNKKTFSGCNHFNLANEILMQEGNLIINWK